MTSTSTRASYREIFTGSLGSLALGLLALEFVASVQVFVVATVLPQVSNDLDGGSLYGVALSAATLALFISLPFTARLSNRWGSKAVLNVAAIVYVLGALATALAPTMLVFAGGRFLQGLASGALASFGLSAVMKAFPERLRPRLIALMSSMWLIPAMIGPAVSAVVSSLVGWRWTLAGLVLLVILGRFLVMRKIAALSPQTGSSRRLRLIPTLLLVSGLAAVLFAGAGAEIWRLVVGGAGLVVALIGTVMFLPKGTFTLRRGRPAALGAFFFLTFAYFGGDGLITLFATNGINAGIGVAAAALASGTIAWVISSLVQPRLLEALGGRLGRVGLIANLFVLAGLIVLLVTLLAAPSLLLAAIGSIAGWAVAGIGMGLAYPSYSVAGLAIDDGEEPTEAANAVILAESLGGALGLSIGGTIVALSVSWAGNSAPGLFGAYGIFLLAALVLVPFSMRIR